jgi:phage terminase small subunit
MARLTEKQDRFCYEYLVDFHVTYAAIRAGYPPAGAHVMGSNLLKNDKIKARIDELRAKASFNTTVSLERNLEQMAKMAYVDPAEMYNPNTGELLPITEMPAHVRAAIVAIEIDEINVNGMVLGQTKKVKLAPREKAVDMINKHLGGYAEDNKQKQPVVNVTVDITDDDDEDPATLPSDPGEDDADDQF